MLTANKRIARNTGYLYVRLLTTMVVGLYTSRLTLEILGVSDYGLFAVVGGVLAVFTFITSSLTTATGRFFNVEMGRKGGDVNASFNVNLLLHTAFALLVLLLAESLGLWYVTHRLNVADGKLPDAVFVYHVSILTACLGIVNNPYQSLFSAHERFRFLAVLDITNVFLRLGCILLLTLYHGPYALRLYSVIFALTIANTFVVYHVVAARQWPDIVRLRWVKDWARYREVLTFGGWNMLATLAYMARTSGSDLLLNHFFGTAVNGASAIGKTVNDSIQSFTNRVDGASAPQVIQAHAAGNVERYTYLCNKLGRLCLLMYELLAFPLLVQLDFLLHLWLGQVPAHTLSFATCYILSGGVAVSCGGIYTLINASGRVKWFKANSSFFFLICLPVGYVLFACGCPPYTLLLLFLVADAVQRVVQLVLMRHLLGYDAWQYVREAYCRPLVIALLMGGLVGWCWMHPFEGWGMKVFSVAACAALTAALVWLVGLHRSERSQVWAFLKRSI